MTTGNPPRPQRLKYSLAIAALRLSRPLIAALEQQSERSLSLHALNTVKSLDTVY